MCCLEAEGEISGAGAANEVAVGILAGRQWNNRGLQTCPLESEGESLGSVLAGQVFILVKDEVNATTRPIGKLVELRGRQMRAEGTGGVAKSGLPQHRQVEQTFDQDHGGELTD